MTNKEIEQLQARLNKLKGNQPQQIPGLGQQFEEMGKSFQGMRESIPKVKVGNNKPIEYAPWAEKIRKWVFYILVGLIGGGALLLIVTRLISRFF